MNSYLNSRQNLPLDPPAIHRVLGIIKHYSKNVVSDSQHPENENHLFYFSLYFMIF